MRNSQWPTLSHRLALVILYWKSIATWSLKICKSSTLQSTNLLTPFLHRKDGNKKIFEHGKTLCFLIYSQDRFSFRFLGYKMFPHFQQTQEVKKQEKGFRVCTHRDYSSPFFIVCAYSTNSNRHLPVFGLFFTYLWAFHNNIERCLKNAFMKNNIHVNNLLVNCIAFHATANCCLIWKAYITGKPQKVTSSSMSDNSKRQEVCTRCALCGMLP